MVNMVNQPNKQTALFLKGGILFLHILGGSSRDLEVVSNHGDRKSPKDQVVGPLPSMAFL